MAERAPRTGKFVTATVVAPAGPAATWARWSDLDAWPEWNPHCVSASLEGPLTPGTRVVLQLRHPRGRDFWTRPRLTAVEPEERLDWAATSFGIAATTATRLAPEPDGTRVTVELDVAGRMGFTYRMTLSDRVQALIWTGILDALVDSLRRPEG
jgi:uncharacterized protein YndB with AHSA1/START domain